MKKITVVIMALLCLNLNAQEKEKLKISASLGGGLAKNLALETQGSNLKAFLYIGNRFSLNMYYDNFKNSIKIKEQYLGAQFNLGVISTKSILLKTGIGVENNLWQNHFKFDNKYAKPQSLIVYPNVAIEYNVWHIKLYSDLGYNINWKEPRLQLGVAINTRNTFSKKDKRHTYPYFGNKQKEHSFSKR